MAKESTIAPKERINIKFKPSTGNAKEEVELPLKMVMVGDFTLKPDDRIVEDRELISIDKDNFNEVMKSHALSLDFSVPNKLQESDDPDNKMSVHLKFSAINDFTPEAIVRQTPELVKLLELREALVALKGPLGNVPAFRKAIQGVLESETSRETLIAELTGVIGDGGDAQKE